MVERSKILWELNGFFHSMFLMLHNMHATLIMGFKFTLKIVLEDKFLPKSEVEHGSRVCSLWSKG